MPALSPKSHLQQEQSLMAAALELMQREQHHLVVADIDSLTEVTAQKSVLVNQMALLAQQRNQALGLAGFAAQEAGMDAWLEASHDAGAAVLWQQLLSVTREAKELNRVNGMLITKHMSNNQNALQALRAPSHSTNSFYGPSGQATVSATSRRLVVG